MSPRLVKFQLEISVHDVPALLKAANAHPDAILSPDFTDGDLAEAVQMLFDSGTTPADWGCQIEASSAEEICLFWDGDFWDDEEEDTV